MPDNASLPARNNPIVFTSLIALALAAAVLAGAALSKVASGAVQDMLRSTGFGRNDEIQAEQHHQAQTLERIELAVGRVLADIALLNARIDGAAHRDQDVVNAAPVDRVAGNPAPNNPGQSTPLRRGPEFGLGALRASFEAEAVVLGTRTSRPHPRRAAKGSPAV